jgi:putative peptidoglycan lipid II flippase
VTSEAEGRSTARRLGAVAVLLAASVALSRVLGYARDAVIAWRLGVSAEVDAYRASFLLPDLMNHLLAGGALSIAFIPMYARVRREQGPAAASHLLAVVLGTTTAAAAAVTALLWAATPALVEQMFGFERAGLDLTARLTRIVLPAQLFFIAGGILRGALMAEERFVSQALAPLIYNLGIIAGGVLLGGRLGAEGFAWGALAGAALGALLPSLFEARAAGIPLRFAVAPRDRQLARYLWLALPLMLGVSLLTVDEWYDSVFGSRLGAGAVAALGYARRLLQLPVGIIGQAIGTAALPFLTRLWHERRLAELDRLLLTALRGGVALAVLAAAALFALAEPAVAVLYERGEFGAGDTARVARLLQLFALSAPAWVVQQIAVRAFYAREDTWRPMWLGTAFALPAALLYLELGGRLGAEGLALAGAFAMSANALATLLWARRLHGGPALFPVLESAGRAALAGLAAAAATWLLPARGEGLAAALAALALGAALFAAVGLPAAFALGDAALRDALARLLRRALRRRA